MSTIVLLLHLLHRVFVVVFTPSPNLGVAVSERYPTPIDIIREGCDEGVYGSP